MTSTPAARRRPFHASTTTHSPMLRMPHDDARDAHVAARARACPPRPGVFKRPLQQTKALAGGFCPRAFSALTMTVHHVCTPERASESAMKTRVSDYIRDCILRPVDRAPRRERDANSVARARDPWRDLPRMAHQGRGGRGQHPPERGTRQTSGLLIISVCGHVLDATEPPRAKEPSEPLCAHAMFTHKQRIRRSRGAKRRRRRHQDG